MAHPEYYRELIDNAHDAVKELLKAGAVDSWIQLRSGYSEIRRSREYDDELIERERKHRERNTLSPTEQDRKWREERDRQWREQEAIWKGVSKAERERVAIELIGEGRLTLADLKHKFQEHYGFDGTIYDSHVRPLAMRLVAAGQLEREPEKFQGKVRYRYFRRAGLSGPIADLERAYHDEEAA